MRLELLVVLSSIFLVLVLSFGLFYDAKGEMEFFDGGVTGFVTFNDSLLDEKEIDSSEEIDKEIVKDLINQSENIIKWMSDNDFSVVSVSDDLIEAKKVFRQVQYAEILRGKVQVSNFERVEAVKALELIDWKEVDYEDVLYFTDKISEKKDKAILLRDKIAIRENELNSLNIELFAEGLLSLSEEGEGSYFILQEAKSAFEDERYDDVEEALIRLRNSIEEERSKTTTFVSLKMGAKNFFQRYWFFIILILILILVGGWFYYKRFEKKLLRWKIEKMKVEKKVLVSLIKKSQIERFKHNKISSLVYNIRMKRYNEKIDNIKQELPVLEEKLKRLVRVKRNFV
jgi:hypothetical protein